jgi:hypothetical protein
MYFVIRSFNQMSDAMACCSSGSSDTIVTSEDGTVLMEHEEVPIDEAFGIMVAKVVLKVQCSAGLTES